MNKSQIQRLLLVLSIAGIVIVSSLPIYSFLSGPHSRLADVGTVWLLLLSGFAAVVAWVLLVCVTALAGLLIYTVFDFIKNGPSTASTDFRGPG